MTNPRYIENMIAEAIANRDKTVIERFKLVFDDNKIQCISRSKAVHDSFYICSITEQQINEGFSGPEWTRLTNKAILIIKELKT